VTFKGHTLEKATGEFPRVSGNGRFLIQDGRAWATQNHQALWQEKWSGEFRRGGGWCFNR